MIPAKKQRKESVLWKMPWKIQNDIKVDLSFSINKCYWTLEHEINSNLKISFLEYKSINV